VSDGLIDPLQEFPLFIRSHAPAFLFSMQERGRQGVVVIPKYKSAELNGRVVL
jgi:hypothetical protein